MGHMAYEIYIQFFGRYLGDEEIIGFCLRANGKQEYKNPCTWFVKDTFRDFPLVLPLLM